MSYTKGETLINVKGVSLRFGDKLILRDVNAEVRDIEDSEAVRGQVVCFLGASGIGKTQLSRIIAGLHKPTTGEVRLLGQALGTALLPVKVGDVGMVQQNYPLFDFATVEENFLIAANRDRSKREHAEALAAYFGITDRMKVYPRQLSGGQRQRAAIIRTLISAGHFMVFDEPFSGLDLIRKREACKLLASVAAMHTLNTIIVITHDVTEGMSIADTVWLMGREAGKPGATIVEEFDLAAKGLAWKPGIEEDREFRDLVAHVRQRFVEVSSV